MQDRWRVSITKLMHISRTTHLCQEQEATSIEGGGSAKGELLLFTVVITPDHAVAISSITKATEQTCIGRPGQGEVVVISIGWLNKK